MESADVQFSIRSDDERMCVLPFLEHHSDPSERATKGFWKYSSSLCSSPFWAVTHRHGCFKRGTVEVAKAFMSKSEWNESFDVQKNRATVGAICAKGAGGRGRSLVCSVLPEETEGAGGCLSALTHSFGRKRSKRKEIPAVRDVRCLTSPDGDLRVVNCALRTSRT